MDSLTNYGNTIVSSKYNAQQRGSGNFNPPPNYVQTTDRGNALNNALNYYETNDTYKYLDQNKYKVDPKKYDVGVSGLYTQNYSWNQPNPENEGNQYTSWAMKSVHQSPNVLLNFYFSTENVDYISNRITQEIKNIKKVDISPQSRDELLIIMRNFYQKALSGWLKHRK